jgi:hypothetical protein
MTRLLANLYNSFLHFTYHYMTHFVFSVCYRLRCHCLVMDVNNGYSSVSVPKSHTELLSTELNCPNCLLFNFLAQTAKKTPPFPLLTVLLCASHFGGNAFTEPLLRNGSDTLLVSRSLPSSGSIHHNISIVLTSSVFQTTDLKELSPAKFYVHFISTICKIKVPCYCLHHYVVYCNASIKPFKISMENCQLQ